MIQLAQLADVKKFSPASQTVHADHSLGSEPVAGGEKATQVKTPTKTRRFSSASLPPMGRDGSDESGVDGDDSDASSEFGSYFGSKDTLEVATASCTASAAPGSPARWSDGGEAATRRGWAVGGRRE